MRIDSARTGPTFFRKRVLLSIGLVASSTLVTSGLMATPAHAFVRHPAYGRPANRAELARLRAARLRASRSGTRTPAAASPVLPAPKPAVAAASAPPNGGDALLWQRLRNCEAGGRYQANSGNGYYGAYQFSAGTWHGLGYPGLPHQAAPETQDEAARKLKNRSGWGQWPACSRRIGAR